MTIAVNPKGPYILWGTPHSLYTGKARSCLIKKGLAFVERCPSHTDYKTRVRPAVGMVTFPVLETPEGQFIQDSTDIVTYLDALESPSSPTSMTPATPVQRVVASLIDGFGLEGLLQAAMHYRWSYRSLHERFINREFMIITYETDPVLLRAAVPEPLVPNAENHVLYEWIRMPDSSGFGDYTESGIVIPCTFNGEPINYTAQMYLDDQPPIDGGREIWGFPKKYALPKLEVASDTLTGTLSYAGQSVAMGVWPSSGGLRAT